MKKSIIIALMAGSLLSLTACGNSDNSSKNTTTNNSSKTERSVKETEYSLAKNMMNDERIYYQIDSMSNQKEPLGVNTPIKVVYIFNHGKVEAYDYVSLTLGDLKNLTDKQIIEKVKENFESLYTKNEKADNTLEIHRYTGSPQAIKVSAVTDSTGNKIQTEKISANSKAITSLSLANSNQLDFGKLDNSDIDFRVNSLSGLTFTVFNQEYVTLDYVASESENREDATYITRYDGSYPKFDSLDESFIKVSTAEE